MESYTIILPTVIVEKHKLNVKQNMMSCLNCVFHDLKAKDFDKYFQKSQKEVISKAKRHFKGMLNLPESFMVYVGGKGEQKVECFSIEPVCVNENNKGNNSMKSSEIVKMHFNAYRPGTIPEQ